MLTEEGSKVNNETFWSFSHGAAAAAAHMLWCDFMSLTYTLAWAWYPGSLTPAARAAGVAQG